MIVRGVLLLGLGLALGLTLGCDNLKSPEIVGEGVKTVKMSPQGAQFDASLSVLNPNKDELRANGIDSKVTMGGRPNVARAVITDALVLPGGQRTKVTIPIHVEWLDRAAVSALAQTKQPAEYSVEGTVQFAGKSKVLSTPFVIKGSMTPTELAQAAGEPPK
jgi:LEA14-like dessication related protein